MPAPEDTGSTRNTIWFVSGFVLFLAALILVFLMVAGRLERHSYYQPWNQNPPTPTAPATPSGP